MGIKGIRVNTNRAFYRINEADLPEKSLNSCFNRELQEYFFQHKNFVHFKDKSFIVLPEKTEIKIEYKREEGIICRKLLQSVPILNK